MTETRFLHVGDGRRIAYHRIEARSDRAAAPGVIFLGGFRSDMNGTKALHLEDWAREAGRGFLRFDYSGHGESSGEFLDGSIGDWVEDALAALDRLTEGPQVLVGSSMGGWISLLLARLRPERIAALVGVAAAPDFTEDGMWAAFTEEQREELGRVGSLSLPSDYSDEPYVITRRLIEDGRERLVLRAPLKLPFPVRLLQGSADADVPMERALAIMAHAECPDLRVTIVKDADHRFSSPRQLALLVETVEEATRAAGS